MMRRTRRRCTEDINHTIDTLDKEGNITQNRINRRRRRRHTHPIKEKTTTFPDDFSDSDDFTKLDLYQQETLEISSLSESSDEDSDSIPVLGQDISYRPQNLPSFNIHQPTLPAPKKPIRTRLNKKTSKSAISKVVPPILDIPVNAQNQTPTPSPRQSLDLQTEEVENQEGLIKEENQHENQNITELLHTIPFGDNYVSYTVTRKVKKVLTTSRTTVQLVKDNNFLYSMKFKGLFFDGTEMYINAGKDVHISGTHSALIKVSDHNSNFSLIDSTNNELAVMNINGKVTTTLNGMMFTTKKPQESLNIGYFSNKHDPKSHKSYDFKSYASGKVIIAVDIINKNRLSVRAVESLDPLLLMPFIAGILNMRWILPIIEFF